MDDDDDGPSSFEDDDEASSDDVGGEWDEAMETRFMYSADAKTGTVNRKAAQRVLAKAERWNKWQAQQLPERDPARAPALPTAYIAPKGAPSPTSILATSKSAPTFASPLPVAAVVDELVAGALERAVSGTTAAPASATEETAAENAAPVPETASETPPETAPAPETAAPAAFRERKKSKLLSLVEVGGLDVERFGSHLEKAFARENLSFVLRCRDYKALVEGGAPAADARRVAEEIRVLYVGEAAPDLVSLPPKDVAACLAALDGDAPLPADLFDALLHHTADELSRTNLGPFLVEERRRDLEAELLRTDAGATEVRKLRARTPPSARTSTRHSAARAPRSSTPCRPTRRSSTRRPSTTPRSATRRRPSRGTSSATTRRRPSTWARGPEERRSGPSTRGGRSPRRSSRGSARTSSACSRVTRSRAFASKAYARFAPSPAISGSDWWTTVVSTTASTSTAPFCSSRSLETIFRDRKSDRATWRTTWSGTSSTVIWYVSLRPMSAYS